MSSEDKRTPRDTSPEMSRYAFAMFDVLGFTHWVENERLEAILTAYQQLIERAVLKLSEKGSLTTVQTREGALLVASRPPNYAYFSDTILVWCPLAPPAVADFVERCSSLICEALEMNIPLRGAITLGDAVLDKKSGTYIGNPIIEAARIEKGQDWIGLTLGNSAIWSPFLAQIHGSSLIEYPAPMKPEFQKFAGPIVVDWPRRWRDKNGSGPNSTLEKLIKPHVADKYANTLRFVEYSESKHDWFKHPETIPHNAVLRLFPRSEIELP